MIRGVAQRRGLARRRSGHRAAAGSREKKGTQGNRQNERERGEKQILLGSPSSVPKYMFGYLESVEREGRVSSTRARRMARDGGK
jgi:hypothetical protein